MRAGHCASACIQERVRVHKEKVRWMEEGGWERKDQGEVGDSGGGRERGRARERTGGDLVIFILFFIFLYKKIIRIFFQLKNVVSQC
jgi:hypothetical protein